MLLILTKMDKETKNNIFNKVKGYFGNNLDLFLDLSMVLYNIGISKGYKLKTNEMKRNLKE